MTTVAFGALGGTISMTGAAGEGISPTLGADDLVAAISRTVGVEVHPTTLQAVGSSSLTPQHLLAALDWAEAEVDGGAAGVVIAQGTDTLEETAYFWDLLWQRPEPLIVTAAMRGPQQPGADGPGNLAAALTVAADDAARDRGVLAVLDDQVHRARWVRKAHTALTGAFESAGVGPIGVLAEDRVHWLTAPEARVPAPAGMRAKLRAVSGPWPWVPLIEAHLDDTGRLARAAVEAGAAGLVISGTGAGHVSAAAAEALGELTDRVPVLLASRTLAGPVFERTYGYPGAEIDLIARGLLPTGWIPPLKARMLLQLLLVGGMDRAGIGAEVSARASAIPEQAQVLGEGRSAGVEEGASTRMSLSVPELGAQRRVEGRSTSMRENPSTHVEEKPSTDAGDVGEKPAVAPAEFKVLDFGRITRYMLGTLGILGLICLVLLLIAYALGRIG